MQQVKDVWNYSPCLALLIGVRANVHKIVFSSFLGKEDALSDLYLLTAEVSGGPGTG